MAHREHAHVGVADNILATYIASCIKSLDMFGSHFFEDLTRGDSGENTKEAPKRPKSPPRTCDEWFCHAGISQWPSYTPDEALVDITDARHKGKRGGREVVMGSLEEIRSDLEAHSSWDSAFLDNIDRRLQSLEKNLTLCADRFICEPSPTAQESAAGGLTIVSGRTFLTELCDMEHLNSTNLQASHHNKLKLKFAKDEDDGKSVEALVFPGFAERSTVPLPGKLEPLPLLDTVTKTLTLPPYLMKPWRKLFYSDASCSIFQSNAELQARLFDKIADSFVALLHAMEGRHKDEVFMHYPGCLAQALYSAFCHAFPKSNRTLNSNPFLSYLTNITSEWIAGIKSTPMVWEGWPCYLLDPYHTVKTETESRISTAAMQRPRTHKQSGHVHFRQDRSVRKSASLARHSSTATTGKRREDKGVGPGPTFECVQFSILGRSPLLQHYLLSHHLMEEEGHSRPTISRIQVKELQPGPSVTYTQLLEQSARVAKENYETYERQIAKCDQEVNAAHKIHITELRAMERRNKHLLQHRHEVAILAEKLMSKRTTESLPPMRTSKSAHGAS